MSAVPTVSEDAHIGPTVPVGQPLMSELTGPGPPQLADEHTIGPSGTVGPASPSDDLADGAEGSKKEKKKKKEKDETMGNIKHEDLDWIWIGGAEDARDREALQRNNVRYILNCTPPRNNGGVSNFHEKDPYFSYCRLSMGDNATETLSTRFEAAWDFFERARVREDGGILVHCQQGVSRSCSMVISYMMKYYRIPYEETLAIVKVARKQGCPNEGFDSQLREFGEELKRSNGWEKVPPKRNKPIANVTRGPVGPTASVARGPARGPAGPTPGPAKGPMLSAVGPVRGPGPVGPTMPEKRKVGPVGPALPPGVAKPDTKPAKKQKTVGPARP